MDRATKQRPKPPISTSAFEVGEWVYVVFWRPAGPSTIILDSRPLEGEWDVLPGRIVSCGKLIAFETSCPHLNHGGTVESVPGSSLRFTTTDRVFRTHDEAEMAARTMPTST